MEKFSLNYTIELRKDILEQNKDCDSVFIKGKNNKLMNRVLKGMDFKIIDMNFYAKSLKG